VKKFIKAGGSVKKFIKWLKGTNENAKARAKLVLHAKERMACMDELWRQEADKSCDAVALLLMRVGVAHIEALERMACMDELWRQEADKSCDAVALLLMRIGVAHIEALYQGKMMEQNVIRGKQAYLN